MYVPIILASPSLPKSMYPLRLIDVEKTLGSKSGRICFVTPTSWAFHTISHVWTQAIVSWAQIIIEKCRNSGRTYDQLFLYEDFSQHPCYPHFVEFLSLLRADGVKLAWLDTLCIDQRRESEEKNQELQNMGSYYAKSSGCYVCANGFGEGLDLCIQEQKSSGLNLVLPRWFYRVWTFQEMLLPKKLTFILKVDAPLKNLINYNIRKMDGIGFCRCVMQMRLPLSAEGEGEEGDILCTNSPCVHCGEHAFIRTARERNAHYIERECIAYLMIMYIEEQRTEFIAFLKIVYREEQQFYVSHDSERKLIRLMELVSHRESLKDSDVLGAWDAIQVVVEVSRRDCTIAEDRVLSILGLLGPDKSVQLRSGKTLDEQVLDLAQQLCSSDPTSLVKLCIAQFAGHTTEGMSWAPSLERLRPAGEEPMENLMGLKWNLEFRKIKQLYERQMEVEEGGEAELLRLSKVMNYFTRRVELENVLADGSLQMSMAQVLWNCRFVRVDQNLFHLHGGEGFSHPFQFQAYFSPSSCLLHHGVFIGGAKGDYVLLSQSMVRLEGKELSDRLTDFKVSLVLLGELTVSEEQHDMFMVCVGENLNALHKVGIGWIPCLRELCKNSPSKCRVGGFKDYMEKFVLK